VTPRLSQGAQVTADLPVTLKVSQAQDSTPNNAPLLGSNIHNRHNKKLSKMSILINTTTTSNYDVAVVGSSQKLMDSELIQQEYARRKLFTHMQEL
jgi:hypothetical protein